MGLGYYINITAWRADEDVLFFSVLFKEISLLGAGLRKGIMCSSRLQLSAVLIWITVDSDLTRKQDGHGSHCS